MVGDGVWLVCMMSGDEGVDGRITSAIMTSRASVMHNIFDFVVRMIYLLSCIIAHRCRGRLRRGRIYPVHLGAVVLDKFHHMGCFHLRGELYPVGEFALV